MHLKSLATGGEAVGRDENGRACFVPFGAPGDVALISLTQQKKNFARGFIHTLLEPSPLRVEPPCPYYLPHQPERSCGGCQIQHLQQEAQLESKRTILRDSLQRLGGFMNPPVEPCRPSPLWHYRNKGDFVIGGTNKSPGEPRAGFFARNSHDLIAVERCPLQCAPNNEALAVLQDILRTRPEWGFDARCGSGFLRRMVARTSSTGELVLTLVGATVEWPAVQECVQLLRQKLPKLCGVLLRGPNHEDRLVWGQDFLEEQVGELTYRVHGDGFFQVNPALTPEMVRLVLDMADLAPQEDVLDLYCGVGLFGLAAATGGARVHGIELSERAIQYARVNAQIAGLDATFAAGDAGELLAQFQEGRFSTVILDPPRAGAAEAVPHMLRIAPDKIVYVSCDPATFARDAASLCAGGYGLERAIPLDLFPHTAHVETVALFLRNQTAAT